MVLPLYIDRELIQHCLSKNDSGSPMQDKVKTTVTKSSFLIERSLIIASLYYSDNKFILPVKPLLDLFQIIAVRGFPAILLHEQEKRLTHDHL